MNIYIKERLKILFSTILTSFIIIAILWLCLFITDYIMFNNDKPIIFAITKVEDVEGKHYIYEKGLGYFVKIYEEEDSELYLFGNKIKSN